MTGPILRRAVPDDAPGILRLFDEAIAWFVQIGNTGQWGTEPLSSQTLWQERVSDWCDWPESWVATHPKLGVCAAMVLGDAGSTVPAATEPELYVRALIGSRDPLAKGTGRHLLALADDRAKDAGVSLLRVDCYAGGTGDLIAFYESCGYTRTETFTVERQPQNWPGQVLARRIG